MRQQRGIKRARLKIQRNFLKKPISVFLGRKLILENIQGGTKVFGSCSSKEKQQQEQRVEAIECKRTSRATFAHAQILLALACVTEWRNS